VKESSRYSTDWQRAGGWCKPVVGKYRTRSGA